MKLLKTLTALAALTAATQSSHATGIGTEAAFAQVDGINGGELGLGYGYDIGPLRVAPSAGAYIYRGDPSRFFLQTQLDNSTACIDSTDNMIATLVHCNDLAAQAYGKIEATLGIPGVGRLGGGYRISESSTPYGTVILTALPVLAIKGSVGNDYYAVGLSLGF